jgi:hypothetical protein
MRTARDIASGPLQHTAITMAVPTIGLMAITGIAIAGAIETAGIAAD